MNLTELGAALGPFFDISGSPSHQQLRDAFARHGLGHLDPAPEGRTSNGSHLGKMKRIRHVFASPAAHNATAGLPLARELVAQCRAHGGFNPDSESYAGSGRVTQLVQAFAPLGFTLEPDGSTRPTVIDNLSGTELTVTLRSYVDRINSSPDDAPLQVGTGKELDEAAARHVLTELLGDYPVSGNFPVTLTSAFTAIGMATPTELPKLDPDPHRAVHQCLFLLATAVNRLRNDAGTGHGRPGPPRKTTELSAAEARLVARATALVAGALLDKLDGG
ncbi:MULTISPECIES: abortive infection family protein [Mycobacteriaceae]|uniref:Abortive infection protein-like C-terminal domain-containing protein n=1 Tax=Mycolicibacterium chlorophenolicum TaxID=37916 RepID=A0A0J6W1U2_9MYCO|nr:MULTISPECIES: abortive infection family protein [Mycobacteriaceae]KMO75698.1 hypothetical protein MCHLDSM_03196 [Mycolicibacterium chlorophenolicum]QSM56211.1 abortive infection family protein [Mycobacteroides abscessus subsp. abscessus]